jgi:hypothetical protein
MTNNRGNPTYKKNEVSFLLAYFQKKLCDFDEPIILLL